MSGSLAVVEAVRRARRPGEIYRAWCSGYAAAREFRALQSPEGGSLGTWWRRGYRHGLTRTRRLPQLELQLGYTLEISLPEYTRERVAAMFGVGP